MVSVFEVRKDKWLSKDNQVTISGCPYLEQVHSWGMKTENQYFWLSSDFPGARATKISNAGWYIKDTLVPVQKFSDRPY